MHEQLVQRGAEYEVKLESVVLYAVDLPSPSRRRRDASEVERQMTSSTPALRSMCAWDETSLHLVSPQQSGRKHDSILNMQAQRGGTLAQILLPCFCRDWRHSGQPSTVRRHYMVKGSAGD
jgi:hypothetical protein